MKLTDYSLCGATGLEFHDPYWLSSALGAQRLIQDTKSWNNLGKHVFPRSVSKVYQKQGSEFKCHHNVSQLSCRCTPPSGTGSSCKELNSLWKKLIGFQKGLDLFTGYFCNSRSPTLKVHTWAANNKILLFVDTTLAIKLGHAVNSECLVSQSHTSRTRASGSPSAKPSLRFPTLTLCRKQQQQESCPYHIHLTIPCWAVVVILLYDP
eukprot:scaffold1803_cov92-Amphora_coffeaeformis.AAC.64